MFGHLQQIGSGDPLWRFVCGHAPFELTAIVLAGGNAMQIAEVAQKAGVRDLRQSALMKARNGVTSLAEINRVTKD